MKRRKGTAAMTVSRRRHIASKGGKAKASKAVELAQINEELNNLPWDPPLSTVLQRKNGKVD